MGYSGFAPHSDPAAEDASPPLPQPDNVRTFLDSLRTPRPPPAIVGTGIEQEVP